jgi:hypothetical protein
MRTLTTDLTNALAAENVTPVLFAELDFSSGFLRVHTGVGTLVVESNNYTGVGTLGQVETIEESTELQSYGLRLSLSGIPNTLIGIALTEHYQGRALRVLVGALDVNHVLIASPVLVFAGRMDNMQITLGPESASISLNAENRLIDWDRPRIRRYNNSDQQAEYPGDLGFEFAEQMVNKTLFWGKISSI